MSVIALGKLGGRELNYSSDIDLMFVYTANGETDGEHPISNKEFYKKVANQYTELLSTYTAEGLCYRVDLRLRPDGSLGEVCISLEGAKNYYQTRARDWELQMLIKARVAAGDPETGRELLDSVEPLIYSTTLDFSAVEAVSATRERISEKLNRRRLGQIRVRRQAGARRHPRHRVSGAVPAAPARRTRALGAARRNHAGAVAAQRQGSAFRRRISGAWFRPIGFCATWSTGCNSLTTARPTPCHLSRATWICWPRKCRLRSSAARRRAKNCCMS